MHPVPVCFRQVRIEICPIINKRPAGICTRGGSPAAIGVAFQCAPAAAAPPAAEPCFFGRASQT
ncbi:MAG TPA: hypothetical protein PLP08_15995, partial [Plasticicumulans sp.]|uniref:hypothetical protein n=1 Tax=Plasticicumulans sp. TaxID=2307179 RepID=UPI002C0EA200